MNLKLGVLEEIVLLILLSKESTYAVEIAKEYQKQFDQTVSLPAIHVVLKRLEKRDFVRSKMGEPTAERGGRRKRIFFATKAGYRVTADLQEKRNNLWKMIPNFNFSGI
ncbi:MAG: PadR family transcriptional regulator [Bacteroidota bacterium]